MDLTNLLVRVPNGLYEHIKNNTNGLYNGRLYDIIRAGDVRDETKVSEKREEALYYLKNLQDSFVEGAGYEIHPLPEWYAIEQAISDMMDMDKLEKENALLKKALKDIRKETGALDISLDDFDKEGSDKEEPELTDGNPFER